jgi:AraC-like DNA-binding protein
MANPPSTTNPLKVLHLRNMVSTSCIRLIKRILHEVGVSVHSIKLGEVELDGSINNQQLMAIEGLLSAEGFPALKSKNARLAEQIKLAVIDLVHYSTYNAMVRNSDYLVERFDMTYQHLSSVFQQYEHITLEKYIILQRIERVKELIQEDELSLSEIAFMMGYSSVQYLSTQFKNITGVSVTDFKKDPAQYRKGLDQVGSAIEIVEIFDDAYIRPE